MKERIHIEPPRLDAYGRPVPDRFLMGVTVELDGTMFFIGEKMFLFHDMADLIETAKSEMK